MTKKKPKAKPKGVIVRHTPDEPAEWKVSSNMTCHDYVSDFNTALEMAMNAARNGEDAYIEQVVQIYEVVPE